MKNNSTVYLLRDKTRSQEICLSIYVTSKLVIFTNGDQWPALFMKVPRRANFAFTVATSEQPDAFYIQN